jgi:hypothetical protein
MFASDDALDRFVKNVATTRLGRRYFISTTFDGETVERELHRAGGGNDRALGTAGVWNVRRV